MRPTTHLEANKQSKSHSVIRLILTNNSWVVLDIHTKKKKKDSDLQTNKFFVCLQISLDILK